MKERFTEIIKNYAWGEFQETRCGGGSTWEYTENLRANLPILFEQFNIKSIFDGPCGDFAWMAGVNFPEGFSYYGGDIVDFLIDNNKKIYNDRFKFEVVDLTIDKIPKVDLFFCRDLLFHLSYENINKVLQNFIDSGSKFFATSNHLDAVNGPDIQDGGFKLINLLASPFNFSTPIYSIKDWQLPYPPRLLLVWDREAVVNAFTKMQNN